MLVLRLRHERQARTGVERRIGDRLRPERDAGDRDDANARVLPGDARAGRGVAQVVAGAAPVALEPETKTFAQNRERTAAVTRSTDGMYASSIVQYGYGTS